MERVWIRYGDDCKRFPLVNGKLDLGRIAGWWKLDPYQLYVGDDALTYENGLSAESIDQIREAGDELDGKHRNTALVLLGAEAPVGCGTSAVELRDALDSIRSEFREMKSESSRTRSASKINVADFQRLRESLKVVVVYEDVNGNELGEDVLDELVGDDKFWNDQQKSRYIAQLKEWVPEGRIRWKDADGHTINRKFTAGPFPVSGQNDQVAYLNGFGMEQGALLGVELKRKVLTRKGLRQAEIEFYLWGDVSLLPFVQLITDMQTGGVAMYCRSREAGRVVIVQVLLRDMNEVTGFVKKVLSRPPSKDAVRYEDETVEGIEPSRKRFRPVDAPMKEYDKDQRGTGSPEHGVPVPSPSQLLLWTLGPQLLAEGTDVANLADLECFDLDVQKDSQVKTNVHSPTFSNE